MSKSGRKVTQKSRNFGSVSKNFPRRILWHNRIFQKKEMKFPYFPHKSSIQCTYLRLDVNLRDCTLSLSQIYSLYPRKKFSSGKSDKILARWQRFSPTKFRPICYIPLLWKFWMNLAHRQKLPYQFFAVTPTDAGISAKILWLRFLPS